MRSFRLIGILLGVAVLASACSSGKKVGCPQAVIAADLDTLAEPKPGSDELRLGVKLASPLTTCHAESGGIAVDSQVLVRAFRSDPAVGGDEVKYFVALIDSNRTILAKEIFSLKLEFLQHQNFREYTEKITEHLPIEDTAAGVDYAVIFGFELTKEQLTFNREHRRP
ncbi:MAG TPA: hypothetical protein VKT70_03980 [Stellaceae bacterium]|nr:hypothetical protein [Stellaceae bacterium]